MRDLKFDPRVMCAFCETVVPLDDAFQIHQAPSFGGRLIAYLCPQHAKAVTEKPAPTKERE